MTHSRPLRIRAWRPFLLSLGLIALASRQSAAGVNIWTPIGPDDGPAQLLAVDPVDRRVVYAACGGANANVAFSSLSNLNAGLFKSVDGGISWRPLEGLEIVNFDFGRRTSPFSILAIAIDPTHPSTLYVSVKNEGIAKSVNGGATWFWVLTSIENPVGSGRLEADPAAVALAVDAAGTVYASLAHDVFDSTTQTTQELLFSSEDGGETWASRYVSPVPTTLAAASPGVAYALRGSGVLKTTDFGRTWTSLAGTPGGIQTLAVDPRDPRIVYAGDGTGMAVSTDGGNTWSAIPVFLSPVTWIAFGSDPFVIYAGDSAIFASPDGIHWSSTPGAPVQSAVVTVSGALLTATLSGVKVLDQGTWRLSNLGLSALSTGALWTDVRLPSLILASEGIFEPPAFSFDWFDGTGSLYRSEDGGTHWAVTHSGEAVISIAADASDPTRLIAVSSHGVLMSSDGGQTWSMGGTGLPSLTDIHSLTRVAGDPRRPGVFYVSVATAFGGNLFRLFTSIIYRSEDSGATWSLLFGDPGGDTEAPGGAISGRIIAFSGDPSDDNTLYALSDSSNAVVSRDGGATWSPTSSRPYFLAAAVDTRFPGTAYRISLDRIGVERTTDAGASWSLLARGLRGPPSVPHVTAVDYSSPDGALAGTARGVLRCSVLGHPNQCEEDPRSLCLQGDRFQVRARFSTAGSGALDASASPIASDTGTFRFFSEENLELMVKVLDGRAVNGNFWVFIGALSDVSYTVTIMDLETGNVWTHENPQGDVASVADTSAFPATGESASPENPPPGFAPAAEGPPPCGGSATGSLCFLGRFRAEATWNAPSIGTGSAVAVPLTEVAGAMWFFSPNNLELILKVVDGRAVNGKFWVFVGGLTNVEYNLVITDSQTGTVWTRHNLPGDLASVADTSAF